MRQGEAHGRADPGRRRPKARSLSCVHSRTPEPHIAEIQERVSISRSKRFAEEHKVREGEHVPSSRKSDGGLHPCTWVSRTAHPSQVGKLSIRGRPGVNFSSISTLLTQGRAASTHPRKGNFRLCDGRPLRHATGKSHSSQEECYCDGRPLRHAVKGETRRL